jgi:2-hydroxychromene-2-carboxylate isomerase
LPHPITLDLYYSLSSPWAYLAGPRLQDIVRRHRAKLVLKPYDFQEVVPRTGGVPLRTRPEPRRRYHDIDLARSAAHLGMPIRIPPKHYPWVVTDADWNKRPGWMVIAAQERGLDAFTLSHAILRALWAEERDVADAKVRQAIADENAFDGAALVAAETSPNVQQLYRQYTEDAARLGVFGAPTFIAGGELYWGQDRLDFVDRKLAAMRASDVNA